MTASHRLSVALVALALVATACDGKSGGNPEGTNPGECSDGADNDSDGDYDCNDSDCAGAPDCDGKSGDTGSVDADGDGVPADADCDDTDASSTVTAEDADCDGVLTADDCDDTDASSTVTAEDADCDGVLTADDCDDTDASSTVTAEDADCDGVLTADDCDDTDASSTVTAEDADCDGVLTADDCDDTDASSTVTAEDADCDGVLTADDCDDTDPGLPADDADCDGVLTADDCDDTDASVGLPDVDDPDCDGVPTHAGGGNMILIPAGSFDMGCTPGQSGCFTNESPVMPVTLTHDYYMGETEVTQAEYEAVMGINPSYFTGCGTDCPVEDVNWHEAAAYANALSSSAGLTECYTCSGSGEDLECDVAMSPYDCDGYRLPTEAEWEGAARCGEDRLYAGSDDIDAVGWYQGNSGYTTYPVAGKDANACGLYDMTGNVWEWTQDWYADDYTADGRTDPEGASESAGRVLRGGCWNNDASYARVAFRFFNDPSFRNVDLGFRLTRTVP